MRPPTRARARRTDPRGSARFSLVRKVGGQEVRLDVDCTPVPTEDDPEYYDDEEGKEGGGGDKAGGAGGDDDEEEDGAGEGYRVLISVADGAKGQVLQVGAFVTDALRIQRVTLHKAGAQPSADEVFSGSEANSAYGGEIDAARVASGRARALCAPTLQTPSRHPPARPRL